MPKKIPNRLYILSRNEVNEIYDRPIFNPSERQDYFAFDQPALDEVGESGSLSNKIYLLLLIGYFRAKPVISHFKLTDAKDDIAFLSKAYFSGRKVKLSTIAKSTKHRLINKMLNIVGFDRFKRHPHETELIQRLQDVAKIYADPVYMFDECITFFEQRRIALAAYSNLQDLISQSLAIERERTQSILSKTLTNITIHRLKKIIHTKGELNKLIGCNGAANGFTPSQIEKELDTHQTIAADYTPIKKGIEKLGLSQENLNYYASIVKHQSIYRLRRYPAWQGLLYVSCFLYFRYREANDKLVIAFCYLTRKMKEAARANAKERQYEDLAGIQDKMKYAGDILHYFVNEKFSDEMTFGEIRKKAFEITSEKEIYTISRHLSDHEFDLKGYEWQYIDTRSGKIANSLRKIFTTLEIKGDGPSSALIKQIVQCQCLLSKKEKIENLDRRIIRRSDQKHLQPNQETSHIRFEFYLYFLTWKKFEADSLFVIDSVENKKYEDYLVPSDEWKSKQEIIEKTGLPKLITPIQETLQVLEAKLNRLLVGVSKSINDKTNTFVKASENLKDLTWSVAAKRKEERINNPIYTQIQQIGIIDLMKYVDQETGYLSVFNNISKKSHTVNSDDILACIFGNGANYGPHKIASTSDRNIGTLRSVNDAYIRPETTSKANNRISNSSSRPVWKPQVA